MWALQQRCVLVQQFACISPACPLQVYVDLPAMLLLLMLTLRSCAVPFAGSMMYSVMRLAAGRTQRQQQGQQQEQQQQKVSIKKNAQPSSTPDS